MAGPSLIATLGANISPFLSELSSAQSQAQKHGEGLAGALGEHITSSLAKIGSLAAVEELFRHSIENAEKLANLSVRTGLPVGELQGLQNVAAKTGTSVESLVQVYEKLGKTMVKAHADSGSEEAGALARLGVTADTIAKGDMRTAFAEMADHLQRAVEITPQLESDLSKVYKNAREAIPALKAMTLEERLFQESLTTGVERMGAMKLLTDQLKDGWAIMKGLGSAMVGQVVLGAEKLFGMGGAVKKVSDELKGSKPGGGEGYAEESKKQLDAKKKAEAEELKKREHEDKEIAHLHELTDQEEKRGKLIGLTNAAKAKALQQEVEFLKFRKEVAESDGRSLDAAEFGQHI